MSDQDREVLRATGLTQRQVADLLGVSLQAVNRGITSPSDYLTPERFSKVLDAAKIKLPEAVPRLEQVLIEIANVKGGVALTRRTVNVGLNPLGSMIQNHESVVWYPKNPIKRVDEEIDVLRGALRDLQHFVILTNESTEILQTILDERVYRFDFTSTFKCTFAVIYTQNPLMSLMPEWILVDEQVLVNTVFGFQPIPETDANGFKTNWIKLTHIGSNYLPEKLGDGFEYTVRYFTNPNLRALRYLSEFFKRERNNNKLAQWLMDYNHNVSSDEFLSSDPFRKDLIDQFGLETHQEITSILEATKLKWV